MKKYVCIGGYVIRKSDGDRHYITGRKVAELYGLDPLTDCQCIEEKDEWTWWRSQGFNPDCSYDKPIALRPRYDGRYDLMENF